METLLLPAVTLSAALALFVTLYQLIHHETVHGRAILVTVRSGLDRAIDASWAAVARAMARATAALHVRRRTDADANVTSLMRHATHTPLTVTHTDNHLSKMREHKSETALTPAQQRKLRNQKLEERF